jgi:subtilase family serine protease
VLRLEALEERIVLTVVSPVIAPVANLSGDITATPAQSSSPSTSFYSPAWLSAAYGADNITFGATAGNGTGQTIVIVDAYNNPDITSDLATFDTAIPAAGWAGLPAPPSFKVLNQTGGTDLSGVPTDPAGAGPTVSNWEFEEALDVEWAHAIAPDANIVLIETNTSNLSDLLTGAATAATLGSVVSMSWGSLEFSGETSNDSTFNTTGVTFLAATGDTGNPGEYPAFSSKVVAVGGTNLYTNSSGGSPPYSYNHETAWANSGDGISTEESEPSFQTADQSSGKRAIPDVVADAGIGVWIYDSYNNTNSGGGWFGFGGTSLATPVWAGLIAIADQGRVVEGGTALTGRNKTLPALYTAPSTDFHKITSSTYDDVTGLGSPIANLLVPSLAAYGEATQLGVTTQPPSAVGLNTAFGLTVGAEDTTGTVDTSFNGTVTISLASNPGGSTLSGTLTATAVNGFATFSNLKLNQIGSGYTLHATATGLTAVTSGSFNVVAGPPVVTPSGTTNTFTVAGSSVAVDAGMSVTDSDTDLSGATLTIAAGTLESGDTLNFTSQSGITGSYASGTLTLSGSATPTQYQTALRSVTFSSTGNNTTIRSLSVIAIDGALSSSAAAERVLVAMPAPVVTASGTIHTYTVGGTAAAVDAGLTVSSYDTDLTGATVTISAGTLKTGDTLNFNNQNGISGTYASGTLTLSGSATPGQYQTALESITFSTGSANTTTRSVSIIADDSLATPTSSTSAAESVRVAIAAPIVTPSGSINTFTVGGAAAAVDAGVTVLSYDTALSSATVTISAGTLQLGDTLIFTNQGSISGSYASGVLTLSGSATPGQYQTALESVTFSTSSNNTTTRSLSIVANDSLTTPTNSNSAAESVKVALAAPIVSPSGATNTFTVTGSAVAVDAGVTVSSYDNDLSGATVTISAGTLKAGDTLNFTTQNGISGSYTGGVLTLSGSATPGQYQTALESITFSTTSNGASTRSLSMVANDGALTSNAAAESVNVAVPAPVVTASGTTGTFTVGGSAVAVDAGVTESSYDTDLSGASVTISAGTLQSGDTLIFNNQNGISGSYASGTLTLSGSATPGQYQTALESVTFSTGSLNTTPRALSIVANDGALTSNTAAETVDVAIGPPVVTPSGSTGTFTVGGLAVAVDAGVTASSYDTDLTGASLTISAGTLQSSDTLSFTSQNGISGSYASGTLTLSGSATPAQYQTALRSVTFSTGSLNTTPRALSIVALDSGDTGSTPSGTAAETVDVAIGPPVVTANQTSVSVTAGASAVVDAAVTVSSLDTDVSGATVTIGSGLTANDTLHFTSQNGISGSYAGGVLTLSGSATPAQYQTALQSVTFSNTLNNSLATRGISIVVDDSGDTGNTNSTAATTQITVVAPITITGAYVAGSTWSNTPGAENFEGYLSTHGLGNATTPSLGYALQTGASQTVDIPWVNVNTISVSFSGAVSNIGLGSLRLVGGTGTGSVAAPSVTGFASDGNNTYSWTLSGSLGNNKYIFAIATTGSSFGTPGSTQVTDSSGAGIGGTFTTGSSTFPSGTGLAGSTFDFAFSVLPADGAQGGTVNSADAAGAKARANDTTVSASYSPYFDYYGAGLINSADAAVAAANANKSQSAITAPTAPAAQQTVRTTGFAALALGVQEAGVSQASRWTNNFNMVGNASVSGPAAATSAGTAHASVVGPTSAGVSTIVGSATSGRNHGRHQFAATDAAVTDFDLADLWI